MTNFLAVKFLQEMIQRLFTKSPKFFQIWQMISAATAAVTGLPDLLKAISIQLPPTLLTFENKTVGIASTAVLFFTLMTSQSTVVAKDTTGTPLKQTDTGSLPFTSKIEENKTAKMDVPTVSSKQA